MTITVPRLFIAGVVLSAAAAMLARSATGG